MYVFEMSIKSMRYTCKYTWKTRLKNSDTFKTRVVLGGGCTIYRNRNATVIVSRRPYLLYLSRIGIACISVKRSDAQVLTCSAPHKFVPNWSVAICCDNKGTHSLFRIVMHHAAGWLPGVIRSVASARHQSRARGAT